MFYNSLLLTLATVFTISLGNPDYNLKRTPTSNEIKVIQELAKQMAEDDQKYRTPIFYKTTNQKIIEELENMQEEKGIAEMYKHLKSLNLELPKEERDSLYALQQELDFKNHMIFQGWLEEFGFLPKEILGEHHYIQQLLLFHPHVDNGDDNNEKIRSYRERYATILIEEVKVGRMPAKLYAMFYDNMAGKILREPQLYGTNQQFDEETGTIKPAFIESITKTNKARIEIGLPLLKEGEYRIANADSKL